MKVVRESAATELADAARFTGRVWRTDYIRRAEPSSLSGLRFVYEPGARSHWHIHEQEQAIIAVFGRGLVSWEGLGGPIELWAGDWWHVYPGVPPLARRGAGHAVRAPRSHRRRIDHLAA